MSKIIVAGSRTLKSYNLVENIITFSGFNITELICGMAKGIDMTAYIWAKKNNIPVKEMPANWEKYGKRAGLLRNEEMAKAADGAIIIWDGFSSGAKNMFDLSLKYNLKTCLFNYKTKTLTYYNM